MTKSNTHIAVFAVLWTALAIGVLLVMAIGVAGLEPTGHVIATVVAYPLIVTPFVSIFASRLLRSLHAATTDLQHALDKDSLTNTYTRQYFFDRTARFHNKEAVLLMVDVDHFQAINDTHGHFVGDVVLREIAYRLTTSVRGEDCLARFGGEEFVVLLPDTTTDMALIIAERMRAAVARHPVRTANGNVAVRVSVGIGHKRASVKIDRALKHAEAALLSAKENGHDQVKVAA